MFGFLDRFRRPDDSLNAITFHTSGWVEQRRQPHQRIWHNARGDGLGLFFFPIAPDIPTALDALGRLRERYRSRMGGGLIQLDVVPIDEVLAVKLILKVPQQPHGMTYVGSWTFPWRDFSYVLKLQCQEDGTTGLRDAIVGDELMAAGVVRLDDQGRLQGWRADLYDPDCRGDIVRNLSEDERYDARFPDHPLSRLRRYLGQLELTIVVSADIRKAPPFTGPPDR
jgi:hypothetical protein